MNESIVILLGFCGVGLVLLAGFSIASCICNLGDAACINRCEARESIVNGAWDGFWFVALTFLIYILVSNYINKGHFFDFS